MSLDPRFPLPVSHSRAPVVIRRSTAVLLGAALFGLGFVAAVYSIGFILTRA